jgi:hypothetical protein
MRRLNLIGMMYSSTAMRRSPVTKVLSLLSR